MTGKYIVAATSIVLALLTATCHRKDEASGGRDPPKADLAYANATHPGEAEDLGSLAAAGKTTAFYFFSRRCEPCKKMDETIDYLASKRPDVAFRKLNIDRLGSTEVDFESPLAQQYDIDTMPYFRIYDDKGMLAAAGPEARSQIQAWYAQAQQFQRGMDDPSTRSIMEQYEKR